MKIITIITQKIFQLVNINHNKTTCSTFLKSYCDLDLNTHGKRHLYLLRHSSTSFLSFASLVYKPSGQLTSRAPDLSATPTDQSGLGRTKNGDAYRARLSNYSQWWPQNPVSSSVVYCMHPSWCATWREQDACTADKLGWTGVQQGPETSCLPQAPKLVNPALNLFLKLTHKTTNEPIDPFSFISPTASCLHYTMDVEWASKCYISFNSQRLQY